MVGQFAYYFFLFLFISFSFFLCGVILVQQGKGRSVGQSFGSDLSSIFGTSMNSVLKTTTWWCISIFICGSVFLSFWTSKIKHLDIAQEELQEESRTEN